MAFNGNLRQEGGSFYFISRGMVKTGDGRSRPLMSGLAGDFRKTNPVLQSFQSVASPEPRGSRPNT